jgi:hypothetical protein
MIASRAVRSLALVLASFLGTLIPHAATAAEPAAGQSVAVELMRYLGLDPAKTRPELESGAVVHNGLPDKEKRPDEIVAAGAMLLVKGRDAATVVDAFLHAETFLRVHEVTRYQALQGAEGDVAAFGSLPVPSTAQLTELVATPRRLLHLSVEEGNRLSGLAPPGADLGARVRGMLGEIFAARLKAFASEGIAGIEPYARENGEKVDPRRELRTAIASLAFVSGEFPEFLSALGAAREATPSGATRNYYWMDRKVEKTSVVALSSELRQRGGKAALGADIHFYASREYNSMLTLIGVIPYGDALLVFAVNHTYTDQVTGMASSLKRSVARNLVAGRLAKQLEETRRRLAS